ncbi:hypothetical protein D9619_005244 [Psilocybe cf. subviscida]|uniref:WD40 repeat-like protein n=1 Tax=Psilocybe cf. subviscida TaxID=2480587 RepID=A0A8H5BWT9_9AGAR|nr:hypothetical protein D9619_005244 [Psilocybe cf. subviscida]
MFAATTDDALCIVDASIIKKAPAVIPACLDLIEIPTSSSWTPDNTYLYIASAHAIHRYDPATVSLREVYVDGTPDEILHIVAKDTHSVVFSKGSKVCVLECERSATVSRIFEVYKSTVNSLSLSNDNTYLLSTSRSAAHVHDLAQNLHTPLRGLANLDVTTAMFHPHNRTRILVGAGKQLVIYDTARPSSPLKTITVTELDSVIAHVACSPFSKALAAVASATGSIALLDLERDKSLVRVISLKVPLTVITFSPDGGAIYAGTTTGNILMQDLRALDTPKSTVLSTSGGRVQTFSIQKRARDTGTKTPVTAGRKTSTADAPLPSRRPPVPKSTASPARSKATVPESPAHRRAMSAASASPTKRSVPKVLSPLRDPHRNSGELEVKISPPKASSAVKPSSRVKPSVEATEKENPRRARTLPSASGQPARKPSATANIPSSTSTRDTLAVRASPQRRPRALSSVSTAGASRQVLSAKEPAPASSSSRPSSSASRARSTRDPSTSPVRSRPGTASSATTRETRTPSPDLPEVHHDVGPETPVPAQKKKSAMNVLGLGTPEVERWAQMGNPVNMDARNKGKGKMVGFQDGLPSSGEDEDDRLRPGAGPRERVLSMELSPRRPMPRSTSGSSTESFASPAVLAAAANMLQGYNAVDTPAPGSGAPPPASAQDLLRTIVQDVMFDLQRETKAEMVGLHLDLLRMGRGWKAELRTLMDEYVGDLRDLREENQRLRVENERLRRGGY